MGVKISDIVPSKQIEMSDLSGKIIAIDAFNSLYQFLSTIRDRETGQPLMDSKGRITSHLSGLFYRTVKYIESGIRPVYVFDGEPPGFKKKTIEERLERKKEAEEKWKLALEEGKEAKTYAQAASRLTEDMVNEAKELLRLMGLPVVQAPSEGEAQCAYMAKKGSVWTAASQDYDSLLFGAPKLVRNLSITGRRKLPRKDVYIEIKPELILLDTVLESLRINREQLIIIGILVGTDYNPEGVKGIGPKKALNLVRSHKTLEKVMKFVKWDHDVDPKDILEFFLNPPVTDEYELKFSQPDEEGLLKFMVDERDFSGERVRKALKTIKEAQTKGRQTSLSSWFKK
ncbi:MAG: flap endonuclease-1 [Candidatus Aenigmarchaeota archaeon]|nr:flap endonuclease-1 [Candidatus Aenigmarchaeota archaeon]